MDFFDIAILLLVFGLMLNKFISKRLFFLSLILVVLSSFSQIYIVGFKWQYVPLFLMILIYVLKYRFEFSAKNNFLKFVSFFLLSSTFIISGLLIYFLPVPSFENENKKYSVGYEEVHIQLDNRKNPVVFEELSNLPKGINRELMIDIYYPSNDETQLNQIVRYKSENWGVSVIQYLNRTWQINIPEFLFNHLKLSHIEVGTDLEFSNFKAPVVVYSHGWAGEKIFATDQLIHIASEGYVVIAIDHTGLAMFTDLPSGSIYNTGSTDASSNVFGVMKEMAIDIDDTIKFLKNGQNYSENIQTLIMEHTNFDDISILGHSTGGGSALLYCMSTECNKLILQDPYFVPVVEELNKIELNSDTYFIYSEDWYSGYTDSDSLTEIEVYRNYVESDKQTFGYYLKASRHYDFLAFGSISPLTKYTFLKGSIDYNTSLATNNYFNTRALGGNLLRESDYLIKIQK